MIPERRRPKAENKVGEVASEAEVFAAAQKEIGEIVAGRKDKETLKEFTDRVRSEGPIKNIEAAREQLGQKEEPDSTEAINSEVRDRMLRQNRDIQRMGSIGRREQIMAEVHNRTADKAASRLSGARSGAQASFKKEINNKVKKEFEDQMGEGLNWKQRATLWIASDFAGRRAVDALYEVAHKMEEQAEKGGWIAFLMILFTYLMALTKDILDGVTILLPGFGFIIGIAFGTIISIFWLMVCGSSHGWVARWFVRIVLRIAIATLFDGLPVLGIFPVYLMVNAWNHWDYIKEIKKAERNLADINERIVQVQRQVRTNANSFY